MVDGNLENDRNLNFNVKRIVYIKFVKCLGGSGCLLN